MKTLDFAPERPVEVTCDREGLDRGAKRSETASTRLCDSLVVEGKMSRRIVVGLDPSDYSKMAIQFACLRAMAFDGTVIGVGVVDLPGIERASRGAGPGSGSFAKHSREKRIREAEETVEGLLEEFKKTCAEFNISHETEHHACDPIEAILDASMGADLIVTGTRSSYYFETEEAPGEHLRTLLNRRVCPVMAVPADLDLPISRVIVAYDGSPASARAIRQFVGYTQKIPKFDEVVLLHIEDNPEKGLKTLERPCQYMSAYGIEAKCKVLPGTPYEVIPQYVRENMPAVVVLGASAKGTLKSLLFGSVSKVLIEDHTVPLYLSA